VKDALQRIAEAERKAGDIVKGGQGEAERIVKEEEEEQARRQEEGLEQAQREAEILFRERVDEARRHRREELETLRHRLETQPLASEDRIREAVELVKERLLPSNGKGTENKS